MDDDRAVVVKDLHKSFKLPHEQYSGVKQALLGVFNGKRGYEVQHVLKGVSFEIKKGEFFGIVGRNGSGKSTLLKLLAGIYAPDSGSVRINGSLTPFIELGVGFNPELTGRENVYMNGALLGLSRAEVEAIYDDIVSFAELEKFMDQKLKNYSSGMQVRLAFSIAIRAESNILLFDEVLAVGDAAFQQKCYEMFAAMKEQGQTIILVTHDMSAVQRFCERAILIDKGEIVLSGNPSDIANLYLEQNLDSSQNKKKSSGKKEQSEAPNYIIKNISLSADGKVAKGFHIHQKITATFDVEAEKIVEPLQIGFQIFSKDGTYVFGTNSHNAGQQAITKNKTTVTVAIDQHLGPGTYQLNLAIMNATATKVLRYIPNAITFNIKQDTKVQGVVLIDDKWTVKEVE